MPASTEPTPGSTRRSPIQTIDRTVDLITAVAAAGPTGTPLKALVAEVGLRASTGRTLLSALGVHGLVRQVGSSRRYALGPRFFEWNRTYQLQHDLSAVAAPVLRELWEHTDETVHLSTLQRGQRVDVSVLVSRQLLNVNPSNMRAIADSAGSLTRTAAGKVLLAGAEPGELAQLLQGSAADTTATVEMLDAVRAAGFATNFEEEVAGVCGIAAPVRDETRRVVAAVCVGYPSVRRDPDRERELVAVVVETSKWLSELLGFPPASGEEGQGGE